MVTEDDLHSCFQLHKFTIIPYPVIMHYKNVLFSTALRNSEVVFLVDETDDTNFDLVQKLIYNIIRLFKPGTVKTSVIAFGIRPRVIGRGATYTKVKQIQDAVVKIQPRANKRLYVGRAMSYVKNSIIKTLSKGIPRIVITILQGSSSDNFKVPVGIVAGSNVKLLSIGEIFAYKNQLLNYSQISVSQLNSIYSASPGARKNVRIANIYNFIDKNCRGFFSGDFSRDWQILFELGNVRITRVRIRRS